MIYRLKAWTGPTLVREIADRLRGAGFASVLEGTEHVHWDAEGQTPEGACWNSAVDMERVFGTSFGIVPRALYHIEQDLAVDPRVSA